MILNPDIYHDLAWEIIQLINENREIPARYLLSGKEHLASLKRLIIKFNHDSFYCLNEECDYDPLEFLYCRTFEWVSLFMSIF